VIALASLLIISVIVHTRLRWGDDTWWDERDVDERDEDDQRT
jgi:hypothetical protein